MWMDSEAGRKIVNESNKIVEPWSVKTCGTSTDVDETATQLGDGSGEATENLLLYITACAEYSNAHARRRQRESAEETNEHA